MIVRLNRGCVRAPCPLSDIAVLSYFVSYLSRNERRKKPLSGIFTSEAKLVGDLTETNKAPHFFSGRRKFSLVKAADTIVCERKTMFCHFRKLC